MSGLRRLVLPVDKKEYNDDMPQYPGLMLMAHVSSITAQVGAIGGMVVSPLVWAKATTSAAKPFWRFYLPRTALRGSLAGAVLGVGLTVARASTVDEDGIIDRGFRAYHNPINTSLAYAGLDGTIIGGVVGALGAVKSPSTFLMAARGSAVGAGVSTVGLVGYMVWSAYDAKQKEEAAAAAAEETASDAKPQQTTA